MRGFNFLDELEVKTAENARLRAECDAKSAEIVELQTELHRLRPVVDFQANLQVSGPDEHGRRDWHWRGRYLGTYAEEEFQKALAVMLENSLPQ